MRNALVKKIVCMLMVPLIVSGCSVFSPVKMEQTNTYVLNTLPKPIVHKHMHRINIMVMQPEANQMYETTQMVYSTQPYKMAYFGKNSWAETPSQMLQSLLVQTLQDTHYFHSVGVSTSLGHYDYVLSTQLLNFEQRFFGRASDVVVTARVQVIQVGSNQVVASKQFTVVEMARENTPYGGVVAANQAVAKMLGKIVRFCLGNVR